MTWRKLFTTSVGGALLAIAAIAIMAPRPAGGQISCALEGSGKLCGFHCVELCPAGTCCAWQADYMVMPGDSIPEDPPNPVG